MNAGQGVAAPSEDVKREQARMSRIDEHFHLRAGKTYNSSAVRAYYLLIART
jgi:hypothetical protein